ncbi:MAG: hypothetical protein F6K65_14810 [Moorea sp. SIO3C2]|nr:hypothetical protein [Moorena sp. SIO3C2]
METGFGIKWQHGIIPFFGGGSTLWSAWCPEPTTEEMNGWPQATIKAAQDYFKTEVPPLTKRATYAG